MTDADKTKEELAAVADFIRGLSDIVPNLVKGVLGTLFSEEVGSNVGKAVGNFYKQLKGAGIPEQTAIEMTRDYLGTLTRWSEAFKGLAKTAEGIPKAEEIAKQIKEQVEKRSDEKVEG